MISHTSERNAAVVERTHLSKIDGNSELPDAYLLLLSPGTKLSNHRELDALFNSSEPQSTEDLILSCWARWKSEIVSKLRGPFAFAIFDKTTKSIFIARDHFGLCPLYYFVDNARIIIGTSSKLVRSFLSQDMKRDSVMLADFVNGAFREAERTFFTDIKRVMCAHALNITSDTMKKQRYWSVADVPDTIDYGSPKQEFTDRFRNSVLKDYVPGKTALFLSGGLDSSAIAGILKPEVSPDSSLPCLSLTYNKTKDWNDADHLSSMAKFLGVELLQVESDAHDPLEDMEHWLGVMDGPYFPPGHSVSSRLLPKVRDLGFTHVYSGHGGDEIVSYGLGRLNELAKAGKWWALWREVKGAAPLLHQRPTQVFYRYLTHVPLVRRVQNKARRLLNKNKQLAPTRNKALSIQLEALLTPPKYGGKTAWGRIEHDDRMLQNETLEIPAQATMLEITALCAEASDVTVNMPFFDLDLAELCLSLPSEWKLKNGLTRYVVREAMKNKLPDSVRLRQDKFDFAENFKIGLFADPEKLLQLTDPSKHPISRMINLETLQILRDKVHNKDPEIDNWGAFFLWRVAVLSLWLGIESARLDRPKLHDAVNFGKEHNYPNETS